MSVFFFFFSSRRRHTRSLCDWSSDVCSSDLFRDLIRAAGRETGTKDLVNNSLNVIADHIRACAFLVVDGVIPGNERSEERRVGKECRSRWSAYHVKKKEVYKE